MLIKCAFVGHKKNFDTKYFISYFNIDVLNMVHLLAKRNFDDVLINIRSKLNMIQKFCRNSDITV
jgi:hypothetical protein